MDVQLVLDVFRSLADMTEPQAKSWLPMCHWAVASVFGRLRSDADAAAHATELAHAAGTLAYYRYVLRMAAVQGSADFSVGDVTIKERTADLLAAAKQLYEEAMASVAHLMDDDFAFMEVPS